MGFLLFGWVINEEFKPLSTFFQLKVLKNLMNHNYHVCLLSMMFPLFSYADGIRVPMMFLAPRATLYMCLVQTCYCTSIFEPKPDPGDGRTVVHPVDRQ